MTRYLLDTNVLSNTVKPTPIASLVSWMSEQDDNDLFISTMSVAEIQRGILILPAGIKRARLEHWFSGTEGLLTLFSGRVLSFDPKAALAWARLMADGRKSGRPRSPLDMIVAATAEVHGCIVATDNEGDFDGLPYINPSRVDPGRH